MNIFRGSNVLGSYKLQQLLNPNSDCPTSWNRSARAQALSEVDGRKLRSSPLRDHVSDVSLGVTVVGKMHTAGLKGEPRAAIDPDLRKEWQLSSWSRV
jgi:hypothetical protein